MKATKVKSEIEGMYTHVIEADDGRIYPIEKDYKGRLFASISKGVPAVDIGTIAPFTGRNPDAEDAAIKRLIRSEITVSGLRAAQFLGISLETKIKQSKELRP